MGVGTLRELITTLGMVILLVGTVLPLVVNCSTSDMLSPNSVAAPQDVSLAIKNVTAGAASMEVNRAGGAESVQMQLMVQPGRASMGTKAEVLWYPPAGASDFSFPTVQPENPQGAPPFRFVDIPVGSAVPLDYELNAAPGTVSVDTVEVKGPGGSVYAVSFAHDGSGSAAGLSNTGSKESQDALWWKSQYFIYTTADGRDFTREVWDELASFLQGGHFFIALHFPVPGDASESGYGLPVVMRGDEHPALSLLDHTKNLGEVATFPLEYAPGRHEFLENHLPSRSGWRWMALEPKRSPAVSPPADLPITEGNWEFYNELTLELNDIQDRGRNTTLEAHLCYEGTEAPPGFEDLSQEATVLFGEAARSYQGNGVTCAGPIAVRLADMMGDFGPAADPPFSVFEVPGERVDPPGKVQLMYLIQNYGGSSVTVDLELSSERGLSWKAYRGTFTEPDFSKPLGSGFTLQGSELIEAWVVADIPEGTAPGMETVTITLKDSADPSRSVWQTGTVWIGDWVAPAGAVFTGWIPVAVHDSGAHDSRWRTDVGLLNGGASAADVTITVYGSDGEHTLTRSVAAGKQVILEDMLGQIPYTGGGAVKVVSTGALVVTSRSYSQLADDVACFPGGTLGQFLDSSANLLVVGSGQTAWIPQLVENDRFRTNIALTNVGSSVAEATVTLYDGTGAELTSYGVTLQPGQWKQENRPFANRAGATDLPAGYARVSVSSGSVIGYASVIDNKTNDPTTLPMVR